MKITTATSAEPCRSYRVLNETRYYCTRPRNHGGDHVRRNAAGVVLARWA